MWVGELEEQEELEELEGERDTEARRDSPDGGEPQEWRDPEGRDP